MMGLFRRRRGPPTPASVTAVILAGGRAERFGRPKGLAPLQGRPLVRWVAGLAAAASARTVLVLEPEAEEETWQQAIRQPTKAGAGGGGALPGRRAGLTGGRRGRATSDALGIVHDPLPHKGPAAGVRAALDAVDTDHVLLLAVDMPLLRPDLVLGLMDRLVGHDAVAYHLEGWWRPFPSLWKRDGLVLATERAAAEGIHSLHGLLDLVDARPLGPEFLALFGATAEALKSINTEDDLRAAEARLSS